MTAPHRIEIHSDGPGSERVLLDGKDISRALRGVTLSLAAGNVPNVVLDCGIFTATVSADEVDVWIPEETADLLRAIGWQPPRGPLRTGPQRVKVEAS